MPALSVIMSVYNEKIKWIEESVTSILNQTYRDFEFIIVVDNPDLEMEITEYLSDKQKSDNRIKIIYNSKNVGLANSLNIGISNAVGRLIARMDADDISMPNRFERELAHMERTNADVVSCLRVSINENGDEIGRAAPSARPANITLPVSNCICHPSVIMRREALDAVGGYRNFKKSQDYDLWLRMLSAGRSISIINEYLIYYRIRENSVSKKNLLEQYYISEYQKRLYRQRLKQGKDDFSEEKLAEYINSRHITTQKIKRYIISREATDRAIAKLRGKDISLIADLLCASVTYPEVPAKTIMAFFKFSHYSKKQ